jgi:hypothetical protein
MSRVIANLFQDYEQGKLDIESFHDSLALAIPLDYERKGPSQLDHLPQAVRTYYASWSICGDVLNGGFAQAAFNNLHLFEDASLGLRELGLVAEAALFERVRIMIADGAAHFRTPRGGDIGELFEEFLESNLAELDDEIGDLDLWPVEKRVAYAIRNRVDFERVA